MAVRTVPEPMTAFEAIPAGVYPAKIVKVDSVWKDPDQFHDSSYEQLEVLWEIPDDFIDDDVEREGAFTIRSWFAPSMNERSNLVTKLLPAINYERPGPKEDWDDQDFVGRECQVQIERYTNASGFERNKIIAYMAAPRGKKKAMF